MKINTHQLKKDKDDGSNVSLSGDTNLLQGKNDKDEHMLVGRDNQVGENNIKKHFFVEDDIIARGGYK